MTLTCCAISSGFNHQHVISHEPAPTGCVIDNEVTFKTWVLRFWFESSFLLNTHASQTGSERKRGLVSCCLCKVRHAQARNSDKQEYRDRYAEISISTEINPMS